jgi:hypothetical protein
MSVPAGAPANASAFPFGDQDGGDEEAALEQVKGDCTQPTLLPPSEWLYKTPIRSSSGQIADTVDGVEASQPFGFGSDASASAVVRKR